MPLCSNEKKKKIRFTSTLVMEDYILDKPFINGCNTEKLRLLYQTEETRVNASQSTIPKNMLKNEM